MMTAELPVASLSKHFGTPDVALVPAVVVFEPQPWPGTPLWACPYKIGDEVSYAGAVSAQEARQQALDTVAQILNHPRRNAGSAEY